MSRRTRSRRADNPFDENVSGREIRTTARQRTTTRRRRWPWVLLFLLVALFLLPNILGWSGLHQKAIHYALSDFNGNVSVGKASLGWLQPVSLTNIRALDQGGNELATVESVSTSKSLFQLAMAFWQSGDLGKIEVRKPVARLALRADGSNFEDAIAKFLTSSQNQTPGPSTVETDSTWQLPQVALHIKEGQALITSSSDYLAWQIENLDANIELTAQQAPVVLDSRFAVTQFEIGADNQPRNPQTGNLAIAAVVDPGASALKLGEIECELATEHFPISIAAPFAQRFIGPARSGGQLSTNLKSKIDLNQLNLAVDVQSLQLRDLQLAAPEMLGQDQIQLRNLYALGSLQLTPRLISSKQFELQSDFGKVKSNGSFDVNQLARLASDGKLLNEPLDLTGEIDLAGLVRMLPTTLRLHEDVNIESGTISFQANTRNEADARKLVFNADASNLKGTRGGQPIVWQSPLHIAGAIVERNSELALENLDCQADFLRVAGSGTLESGSFALRGDLSRMVERVGQFVDLSGFDFEGIINGELGWQAAEGASLTSTNPLPIQMGGQFEIKQPTIGLPDLPVWKPSQLLVKFSGAGTATLDPQTSARTITLDTGGARIDIGDENATALLTAPWAVPSTEIQANVELAGSVANWLAHIRNFVDIGTLQADGLASVKGAVRIDSNQMQFHNVEYIVDNLAFDGYGMKIRDPRVNGTAQGAASLNGSQVMLSDVTLIGRAIAARGQNVRFAFGDTMQMDGGIGFRGDVNQLAAWFELSTKPDSIYWFGSAEGTVQFASAAEGTAGQVSAVITDLIAAQQQVPPNAPAGTNPQWTELYRDPQVQLTSQLVLADDFNAIQFKQASLRSSAVNIDTNGTLSDLSQTMIANLQGQWTPSWDRVRSLLAAYTGNAIRLSGKGTKPFAIRGPLLAATVPAGPNTPWISPELEGSLTMGWDQGSFLEVPIGASEISVDLKDSIGRVATRGITFSGGTLQIAPLVDMRTQNPVVAMQPTRVIDNVALTEDTARQWLKYVAPLVADATSAQGNVTVDLESLQMPMLDPVSIEARGRIQVANVVVGAGPLADQLISTAQQIRSMLKPNASEKDLKTWLQLSQQTIPFTIKDQVVYHENVTIQTKEVTIITSGAVGFDQRLQMVAEIPIADDWIDGQPYLAGLKGQRLRIPIGGTVSKPELDRRAIQMLTTDLAKNAASGAINQVISDKLAPKATELQNQLNEKVTGELGRFQDRLGEKLGGQIPGLGGLVNPNTTPNTTPNANPNSTPNGAAQPLGGLGNSLEEGLKKGLGDLFKRN